MIALRSSVTYNYTLLTVFEKTLFLFSVQSSRLRLREMTAAGITAASTAAAAAEEPQPFLSAFSVSDAAAVSDAGASVSVAAGVSGAMVSASVSASVSAGSPAFQPVREDISSIIASPRDTYASAVVWLSSFSDADQTLSCK